MQINHIHVENYKTYLTLDLDVSVKDEERPIILIGGMNGSGKTTLLNHILTNTKGYKVAVIVNDIGEVNIDADLIEKGGIVGKKQENLVALQNGCICCTTDMKCDIFHRLGIDNLICAG